MTWFKLNFDAIYEIHESWAHAVNDKETIIPLNKTNDFSIIKSVGKFQIKHMPDERLKLRVGIHSGIFSLNKIFSIPLNTKGHQERG